MKNDHAFDEQRRRLVRQINRAAPFVLTPVTQPSRCVACNGGLAVGMMVGYHILSRADETYEVCPVCPSCRDGGYEQMERWIRARHAEVIDRRYFVHSDEEDA